MYTLHPLHRLRRAYRSLVALALVLCSTGMPLARAGPVAHAEHAAAAQAQAGSVKVYLPLTMRAGIAAPAPQPPTPQPPLPPAPPAPGGSVPAEIAGTWFSGVVPPTDLYNPSTGRVAQHEWPGPDVQLRRRHDLHLRGFYAPPERAMPDRSFGL